MPNKQSRKGIKPHACSTCYQQKVKCEMPKDGPPCKRCKDLSIEASCGVREKGTKRQRRRDRVAEAEANEEHMRKQLAELKLKDSKPTIRGQDPSRDVGDIIDLCTGHRIYAAEAEHMLHKYREEKQLQFPFVPITKDASAVSMAQTRPFVLANIVTICLEYDHVMQKQLGSDIKELISKKAVDVSQRSMDLLQGLIIYCAWHHYHSQTLQSELYMLLQMGSVLATDLGLEDQEPFGIPQLKVEGAHFTQEQGKRNHSYDEVRALLGLFYLRSIASIFRMQARAPITPWIQECLDFLLRFPESEGDRFLCGLVRIQFLAIRSKNYVDSIKGARISGEHWQVLSKNLSQKKVAISNEASPIMIEESPFPKYCSLSMELEGIEMFVLGNLLRNVRDVFSLDDAFLNSLRYLLTDIGFMLEHFIKIENHEILHLPLTTVTSLWYAMLLLAKGTMIRVTLQHSRDQMESTQLVIEAVMKKFVAVSTSEEDPWKRSSRAIGSLLSWLGKQYIPEKTFTKLDVIEGADDAAWQQILEDFTKIPSM